MILFWYNLYVVKWKEFHDTGWRGLGSRTTASLVGSVYNKKQMVHVLS